MSVSKNIVLLMSMTSWSITTENQEPTKVEYILGENQYPITQVLNSDLTTNILQYVKILN